MLRPLLALALAPLVLAAGAAPAHAAWIATCDMGADTPGGARTFRIAPQTFQEWETERRAFGPNLCNSFACKTDRGHMEARIETASLIFTLTFDPATKSAGWRTQGASGLARTSGACAVRAEAPPTAATGQP